MYIYASGTFIISIGPLITTAIVGASGYSGAELVRLLTSREDVRIRHVMAASSIGRRVDELYPAMAGVLDAVYEAPEPSVMEEVDVVFLALPSGEAMALVPGLIGRVRRIIDLGGDFRLPSSSLYEEFYRHEHLAPSLLSSAVYGLPELNRDTIADAKLVANPGCYATSAILALLPALREGIISPRGIVINSLSGVSGAGRSSSLDYSFVEVNENIRAYKVGTHQHIPEIQSILECATGREVSVSFVPHLVPLTRGIYTTIHADLQSSASADQIQDLYRSFYSEAPFVRIAAQIPQIKNVLYTNYCDIGLSVESRTNRLIVISVIDNLVKGAAGQAIQNMNIMCNLREEEGLK